MLRLLVVCCVCIISAGIADENVVPGCSTSQVRKPNDEQGLSQIEMKEITTSQSSSQSNTNTDDMDISTFIAIYKQPCVGVYSTKDQNAFVFILFSTSATTRKVIFDKEAETAFCCTESNETTSDKFKKDVVDKCYLASKEFLDIREKLVGFNELPGCYDAGEMAIRIVEIGLVLGEKVKQSFKSEENYKKYLINKTTITEEYVPQNDLFKNAIDGRNKELLDRFVYDKVRVRTCISDILLFMHYFPEILRDSCNEYINIQDPYVLELVIDFLITEVGITREMHMAICYVHADNNYRNVMKVGNFTSIIMVSLFSIRSLIQKMNKITDKMSTILKNYGYNDSDISGYKQIVFIDKMLEHVNEKMEQIWSFFLDISEEKKSIDEKLQKVKKNKKEFDEHKTLADLKIEGHGHLCKLIEWNIKMVNEGKKLDVINISRNDTKLPSTKENTTFFGRIDQRFRRVIDWFRRN